MAGAFAFEEGGRAYECTPEPRGLPEGGTWWWFTVSRDSNRYAVLDEASRSTQATVKGLIVAYYERRAWARAQPVPPRHSVGRPKSATTAAAAKPATS